MTVYGGLIAKSYLAEMRRPFSIDRLNDDAID